MKGGTLVTVPARRRDPACRRDGGPIPSAGCVIRLLVFLILLAGCVPDRATPTTNEPARTTTTRPADNPHGARPATDHGGRRTPLSRRQQTIHLTDYGSGREARGRAAPSRPPLEDFEVCQRVVVSLATTDSPRPGGRSRCPFDPMWGGQDRLRQRGGAHRAGGCGDGHQSRRGRVVVGTSRVASSSTCNETTVEVRAMTPVHRRASSWT